MNYIDNSDLFNDLPNNNHIPKGSKVLIVILSVLTITGIVWGVANQLKINEQKKEGNSAV